jgi:hypothetical protein
LCTTDAFGQTVLATDKDTFAWDSPVDTFFAIGDLADVSTYTTTSTGADAYASQIDVTRIPPVGQGIWFVTRVDCPGASWSSGGAGQCCVRALP